ncbi:MAG: class I SAM-dependent methyltransferase [Hyphomicrobiales bacterium]|nr:class I SAM-dependent methyltransferase [Hyphomicrobiales bacterium]
MDADRRKTAELVCELLPLKDMNIVDVGCGNGWLTRIMAEHGAHVIGVEVSPRQLSLARQAAHVSDETYLQGSAEMLPVANGAYDAVVFCNSLHHVDEKGLSPAMREVSRVLKHGGVLYVSEPLAEGPYFELMKPVHNETEVRRRALEILRHGPEYNLLLERQITHVDTVAFPDFRAFHDRLTTINPEIRTRFDEEEELLRSNFERLSQQINGRWIFDQPTLVTILRRG